METKNRLTPFLEALDFSDFRKLANVTCTSDEETETYSMITDPSFNTDTGVCRGFKSMNKTDCSTPAEDNMRRLCKCVDKGISVIVWSFYSKDFATRY